MGPVPRRINQEALSISAKKTSAMAARIPDTEDEDALAPAFSRGFLAVSERGEIDEVRGATLR